MAIFADDSAAWWTAVGGVAVGVITPVVGGAALIWKSVTDTRRQGRIDALAEWRDIHALDADRIAALEKQIAALVAEYERRLTEVRAYGETRAAAAEVKAATLHDRVIILEQQDVERRHENANLKQVINGLRLKLGLDPMVPFPLQKGDPLGPPDTPPTEAKN